MKILFLTMCRINNLEQTGFYQDLLNKFVSEGHAVVIAAPAERKFKEATNFKRFNGYSVLRIKVGNLQKTNIVEKGISTILLEHQFLKAIKKYAGNIKFDLVLYSTPPITFAKVIEYIKKRDNAQSYLLLKDIFPQNAVDLGMFSKKSLIYRYFRLKEKHLYKVSDHIGCMSKANVNYILKHNREVYKEKVHVSPNSIEPIEINKEEEKRRQIRELHHIPKDRTVFVYGGNLGKPQDIPFIIKCLQANAEEKDRFFVICGTGTEYPKLQQYVEKEQPENVLLINGLPKEEYEELIIACDVGLIFLDHRFTIPNFPSRLLSYMQNRMPVLACTDVNTDVGKVIEEGDFGWWCESREVTAVCALAEEACKTDLREKGENAWEYLLAHYTVEQSYQIIMQILEESTIENTSSGIF